MAAKGVVDDDQVSDVFARRGVEGARPWRPPAEVLQLFAPGVYYLGSGKPALEVCVVPAARRPKRDDVRDLWRVRQRRQQSPLLLICPFPSDRGNDAQVCGATDSDLAVYEIAFDQAVALAAAALREPNGAAAVRYLRDRAPSADEDFAGLRNQGMFANHTLRQRVRSRPDWQEARNHGVKLRGQEGRDLVEALGFSIEVTNAPVSVLRAASDQARSVAVFLDRNESYESEGGRFGESSALSLAFTRAERDNIPFVILTRAAEIRLYAAIGYEGVGRKGQAETYVQADISLLHDDELGYVPLLFSADALADGGSFAEILDWSRDYSAALSDRLRDRVYVEVVPLLAVAVAEQHAGAGSTEELDLEALYEETLVILFRLLFLAYAEDRDLLPYRSNAAYHRAALKTTARELVNRANEGKTYEGVGTTSLWTDVSQLFEAVDKGNDAWGVPLYNGGLFSPDPQVDRAGAGIAMLHLTDEQFAPGLTALLTERDAGGVVGPVDFRSLSVRDFGTIYEGLLESSLSIAPSDLALDNARNYVPAREGDDVVVTAGSIYHHNRSGARKASGSYFTKAFAVEHLLNQALEPALTEHLGRLESLLADDSKDEAARFFLDFRCVDLAMGSGHFLVAAVDRIEKRLARFLDEHPIVIVEAELDRLRLAAAKQLGDSASSYEIERRQLLRRQVARRCIYGIDRNRIAVELARLSLWVHTFVPGLPLSFLDHNLVQGDSLTGIGQIEEAVDYLAEVAGGGRSKHGQASIFGTLIEGWLEQAKQPLIRLGRASDATRAELDEVRAAATEAHERAEPVRKLFDLICAMRRGEAAPLTMGVTTADIEQHSDLTAAEQASDELQALHFPAVFPEVFLRERPGFDCLIGNPPWEKAVVKSDSFWAVRFPGLNSLSVSRQNTMIARYKIEHPDLREEFEREIARVAQLKQALINGPYPDISTGDVDLYKAFAWRLLQLGRRGGYIGTVMPRSLLSAAGSAQWRESVLDTGSFDDVTVLTNNRQWVFSDVHPQFGIALTTIRTGSQRKQPLVRLRGPYASLAAYQGGATAAPMSVPAKEFRMWAEGAAFPVLPTPEAGRIFLKMRRHPRLDSPDRTWRFRPLRELHSTDDKHRMVHEPDDTAGLWPVYKGESIDLWEPDRGMGTYYAWVDPESIRQFLQSKRLKQNRNRRSAFSEMSRAWAEDQATLPCLHPRLAFRKVTRATDTRTMRVALVPPYVTLNDGAQYFLRVCGDNTDEAFLLGVLSSLVFDWYPRRIIEVNMSFHYVNAFPFPAVDNDDPRRDRVARLAATMAAVDGRFESWSDALGIAPAAVADEQKREYTAEIDALVAHLYGLNADDLRLIFETFHTGWNYREPMERTLAYFEAL